MTVEEEIDELKLLLDESKSTLESTKNLLEKIGELNSDSGNPDTVFEIKKLQREFILDSFKVNRFQKQYKNWIHEKKQDIIDTDVKEYNLKLGKTARLNSEVEELDDDFESLRKSIKLPDFKFSIHTISQFDDGKLLEYITKDQETGEFPPEVELSQLFSVDSDSTLPSPDFKSFQSLLNIEHRLRIQRRIKYEVLLTVKNQLTSNNRKWTTRDVSLNEFINNKLAKVIQETEEIKKNEYEDLKNFKYSDEEEEDDDDIDDIEQELELDDAMDEENKILEQESVSDNESIGDDEPLPDVEAVGNERNIDIDEEHPPPENGVEIDDAENVNLSTTTTTKENTPLEKENEENMLLDP